MDVEDPLPFWEWVLSLLLLAHLVAMTATKPRFTKLRESQEALTRSDPHHGAGRGRRAAGVVALTAGDQLPA